MKMRLLFLPVIIAGSVLLFSSSANAIGLGLYGTFAKGTGDWTLSSQDSSYEEDQSSDISKFGLGFTLDTALAADRLFNYRLQVGFSKITIAMDDKEDTLSSYYYGDEFKGTEYHLYNNFGFGIFRSQPARVWLGPQIGFGFIDAELDTSATNVETNEFVTFWGSLGLIAGVNINIGEVSTIAIDGGVRRAWHGGVFKIGSSSFTDEWDVTGTVTEAFIDLAVMFRINDTF